MKLLKELNLNVGTGAGVSAHVKPRFKNTMGAPSDSAGSTFSSYMSRTFNDDDYIDDSEEEMPDHILRKRIKINGKYSLNDTLENVNEGALQFAADLAKGIPGLDQIVGNTELLMQSAQAKEALDGLNSIVKSLAVSSGMDAFSIFGTDSDFNKLLNDFSMASFQEKQTLKEGLEKIIDVIKNMIITAAMTFDSLVAIPAFLGGPTGALAEIIANVSTTAGTLLRGVPVETFVFQTLSDRSGIIPKFVDLLSTLMTAGGVVGKLFGGIVGMASDKGGEIIEMFFSEPQELLRRLGDLYKVAAGEQEDIGDQIVRNAFSSAPAEPQIQDLNKMNENKYSILFLLEGFDESKKAKPDFLDLDKDGDKEEPMKKAAKDKEKKNETLKEKEACSECGAMMYEGEKHACEHDHLEEGSFEEIDLEEFSSAGGVAGVALPLGKTPKRKADGKHVRTHEMELKEQIEYIRKLQAYHQKTTNRLK